MEILGGSLTEVGPVTDTTMAAGPIGPSAVPGKAREFVAFVDAVKMLAVVRLKYHAAIAERHGLSMSQIDCLYHVATKGALSMRALGELIGLTPSAMTATADRLVGQGLIQRSIHPNDRRVTLLSATPRGIEIIDESMTNLAAGFPADRFNLAKLAADLRAVIEAYIRQTWS